MSLMASFATPANAASYGICDYFAPCKSFPTIGALFTSILAFIIAGAGLVFFFMLIWGGIRYMLARGDDKALGSARGTLTTAVIGLLIIVSAFIIINLVSFATTGRFIF
jgi:hypothetical protein